MYTDVLIQSVKTEPGRTGIAIILEAQGAGLPNIPDIVWLDGAPFDPQLLRDAARALLERLNRQQTTLATLKALVGSRVDVTAPEAP